MHKTIIAALLGMFTAAVQAADPNALMEKVKWREDGVSRTAAVTLWLTDDRGNERQREVAFIERDRDNIRETRLLIQQPLDVKGTAILLKSDADKVSSEDDIWLYLPALKKVKRLSAANKRGRFVGSEFSYTDLEWLRVEDFSYQLLAEETWQGEPVYKLKALPVAPEVIKKTGYSKKVLWLNPAYDMIVKAVYFDERERELKTMQVDEISKQQGYWTAMVQTIHNLQSGRTTKMVVNEIEYDAAIPTKHFKQQNLKRAL